MSKRMDEANKLVEAGKLYEAKDAIDLALSMPKAKFDETVEMHVKLGVDGGDKADAAREAGADFVGDDDMIEKIQRENWFDYDVVVATPDMMASLGKVARLLGPKGLMPNPKSGTVTMDVTKAVSEIKAGKIEYRLDKTNIIHCPIGKVSFGTEKLLQNYETLLGAIVKAKPAAAKGTYLKSIAISTTMGAGIKINPRQ